MFFITFFGSEQSTIFYVSIFPNHNLPKLHTSQTFFKPYCQLVVDITHFEIFDR
jgi:hypothetical protein